MAFMWMSRAALAIDVYVIAGQSNGRRLGSLDENPELPERAERIHYFHMECITVPRKLDYRLISKLHMSCMGFELASTLRDAIRQDFVLWSGRPQVKNSGSIIGARTGCDQRGDRVLCDDFLGYERR